MLHFLDILREPDDVKIQTECTPFRFEEGDANPTDARVEFVRTDDSLRVVLLPASDAVKQLRLRFRGTMASGSGIVNVLGDAAERTSPSELQWKTFNPHEKLAWYVQLTDGERLDCYGVKTGANCFAWWQCDPAGLTLWLDVRNGADGIRLTEPLVCCEIVCREGKPSETPFAAARAFCRMMCPAPKRSKEPLYGFNNWYWAYGGIDEATVLHEAEYLGALTEGIAARPYMVIDDGWQLPHAKGYNGGPWNISNERFADGMQATAERIAARGCKAGIWFRPLLTMSHVPDEAVYQSPVQKVGVVLDPSHPFTLEKIAADVARIAGWGYSLIKHDFSTYDLFGRNVGAASGFYDKTKTTAQIVRGLYEAISAASDDAAILGCNVIGHLSAGLHEAQRVGDDTSGRSFEWTRRHGIHSMMRLPQTHTFFAVDPDCAAFTARVPKAENFDFLEASAISGCAVFASVTPGILTPDEEARMKKILRIAAGITPERFAEPLDWTRTNAPAEYRFDGAEYRYDWYSHYGGARSDISWLN